MSTKKVWKNLTDEVTELPQIGTEVFYWSYRSIKSFKIDWILIDAYDCYVGCGFIERPHIKIGIKNVFLSEVEARKDRAKQLRDEADALENPPKFELGE